MLTQEGTPSMAIDIREAKRLVNKTIRDINEPLMEMEMLSKVLSKGGFVDDLSWKVLPSSVQAGLLACLQKKYDDAAARLDKIVVKLDKMLNPVEP